MTDQTIKIDAQKSVVGKAVQIDRFTSNLLMKLVWFAFWIAGIASILTLVYIFVSPNKISDQQLGLIYIVLGLFLFYLVVRTFYISKVKNPRSIPIETALEKVSKHSQINVYRLFSFELAKVWRGVIGKDYEKFSSLDVLSALLDSKDMNFILARIGVNKKDLQVITDSKKKGIEIDPLVKRSIEIAKAETHHQIEVGDMFVALCELDKEVNKHISDIKLDVTDIANVVYWQTSVIRKNILHKKRLFDPDNLRLTGGIGRDWSYGFTPMLKQFSYDLTQTIASGGINLEIVGHDQEIIQMEEELNRGAGGNVLLVGEAGVGKRTTLLGFAKKVYEGQAAGSLSNKHIIQIDIDALIARAGSGEITARVREILNEAASAGNVIIFIENIQNLLSSGDAGKVNAAEVLIPYLEAKDLHLVGTMNVADYNRYIAPKGTLVERFTRINVTEPNKGEMIRILEDVVPEIEYQTNSLVTYNALKETVVLAEKYILNIPNPEKSINLLDGASAKATSLRGKTIVVPQDVHHYVSEKYEVPTGEMAADEKKKLLELETIMHKRVIGQEEAINAISNAMRRSRAGVSDSKKPIGSFLFMGSTGVGKTETSKALAEAYFGDENKMIRFDMSEYQNKADIYRLIGTNMSGNETLGSLTTAVREQPFSLILLDEIEKAHPDILNLFLQVLDEGRLKDGAGREVSFTNTIIIATSNAGANLIRSSIQSGIEYEKTKLALIDFIQEKGIYRPEFINRFTSVIVFSPLTKEQIVQIAGLMIDRLKKVVYKNKQVKVEITADGVSRLAELGYDPQMGARPMQRTIQDRIEDILAKKLLSGELKKDDSITFSATDMI